MEKKVSWQKILILGCVSLIALLAAFLAAYKIVGAENYKTIVGYIERGNGLWGVFLYVYIVDLLILPLSPDFVYPIVAGMNPFEVIPVIGTASALGGFTAYGIGRLLGKIPAVKKLTGRAEEKWGEYIRKYGIAFVTCAGILPLPFSTICIASGAVDLPWKKMALCCLIRYLRTTVYFVLFRLLLTAMA